MNHELHRQQQTHPSRFRMGHRCCGTVQYGTPCRSPWCNACTTPRWQASQDRKHPGAAKRNTKLNVQFSHFYVKVFGTISSCLSTRSVKDQCRCHYEMHHCTEDKLHLHQRFRKQRPQIVLAAPTMIVFQNITHHYITPSMIQLMADFTQAMYNKPQQSTCSCRD